MDYFMKFLFLVIFMIIVACLLALPIMWLWNWLMPLIFGLIKITFIQALGLGFLCQTLFGSRVSFNKK